MNQRQLRIAIAALVSAASLLCGCSTQNEPVVEARSGKFKVSVASDGKPAKDFNQPLVHRVEMTPADLNRVFSRKPQKLNLPFAAKKVYDSRGRIKGVKVTQFRRPPGVQSLGLEENDVITAVGRTQARSVDVFWELYRELGQTKKSSLTLERAGRPHKILFFTGELG